MPETADSFPTFPGSQRSLEGSGMRSLLGDCFSAPELWISTLRTTVWGPESTGIQNAGVVIIQLWHLLMF